MVSIMTSIVFPVCMVLAVLQPLARAEIPARDQPDGVAQLSSCKLLSEDTKNHVATQLIIDECDSWTGELAAFVPKQVQSLRISIEEVSPSSLSFSDHASFNLEVAFSERVKLSDIVKAFGDSSAITTLQVERFWPETYEDVIAALRTLTNVLSNLKSLRVIINSQSHADIFEFDQSQLNQLKAEEADFPKLKKMITSDQLPSGVAKLTSCELLPENAKDINAQTLIIDDCDSWTGELAVWVPKQVQSLRISIKKVSPSSLSFSDYPSFVDLAVAFFHTVSLSDIVEAFGNNNSPITTLEVERFWPETYEDVIVELRKLTEALPKLETLKVIIDSQSHDDTFVFDQSKLSQLKAEEAGFPKLKEMLAHDQ